MNGTITNSDFELGMWLGIVVGVCFLGIVL